MGTITWKRNVRVTGVQGANFLMFFSIICGIVILASESDDCAVLKNTHWVKQELSTNTADDLIVPVYGTVYGGLRYACFDQGRTEDSYQLSDECKASGESALAFSIFAFVAMVLSLGVGIMRQRGNDKYAIHGTVCAIIAFLSISIALAAYDGGCLEKNDFGNDIERGPSFGMAVMVMIMVFMSILLYHFNRSKNPKLVFAALISIVSIFFVMVMLTSADGTCDAIKDTYWAKSKVGIETYYVGIKTMCIITGVGSEYEQDLKGDCVAAGDISLAVLSLAFILLFVSTTVLVARLNGYHTFAGTGQLCSFIAMLCVMVALCEFSISCLEDGWDSGVSVGIGATLVFTTLAQTCVAFIAPTRGSWKSVG